MGDLALCVMDIVRAWCGSPSIYLEIKLLRGTHSEVGKANSLPGDSIDKKGKMDFPPDRLEIFAILVSILSLYNCWISGSHPKLETRWERNLSWQVIATGATYFFTFKNHLIVCSSYFLKESIRIGFRSRLPWQNSLHFLRLEINIAEFHYRP